MSAIGKKRIIARGAAKPNCACGGNTIARRKRLVSAGALEDLGKPLMELARDLEIPETRRNHNLREDFYDAWRFVVRTIEESNADFLVACPDCDRVTLYRDGQEQGISYRPEHPPANT